MDSVGNHFPDSDSQTSFWKKNARNVPGRPSPKKDMSKNRQKNASCSTSFQDFQESVSDAWDLGDDEFCIVSDIKISKRVAQSAALSVINSHRTGTVNESNKPLSAGSDGFYFEAKKEDIVCSDLALGRTGNAKQDSTQPTKDLHAAGEACSLSAKKEENPYFSKSFQAEQDASSLMRTKLETLHSVGNAKNASNFGERKTDGMHYKKPHPGSGDASITLEKKREAMQRLASQRGVPSSPQHHSVGPHGPLPGSPPVGRHFPGHPQQLRGPMARAGLQSASTEGSDNDSSKLEKFQSLLETALLNLEDMRQLSWSGIPVQARAVTWRLLSGYLPANLERRQQVLERKRIDYWNLVKQYYDTERDEIYQDTYRQIHIDIPRMSPLIALFQQKTVQEMFERILFIWAIRHPASGYVQGINDLVTPFYMVFLQQVIPPGGDLDTWDVASLPKEQRDIVEADSFWCLSKFLDGIQDNYIFAQLGIQQKVNQLKELIQRIDGQLHRHLQHHGVDYLQFSFRWMNNLLTRELPLHCTIRLWDTYLAESDGFALFQLYVCAAFLLHWRRELLQQPDFQGLMLMLQNLPTSNWSNSEISMLVAEAYRLKYTFAGAPNHLHGGSGSR